LFKKTLIRPFFLLALMFFPSSLILRHPGWTFKPQISKNKIR
jgi:hypothetical protein